MERPATAQSTSTCWGLMNLTGLTDLILNLHFFSEKVSPFICNDVMIYHIIWDTKPFEQILWLKMFRKIRLEKLHVVVQHAFPLCKSAGRSGQSAGSRPSGLDWHQKLQRHLIGICFPYMSESSLCPRLFDFMFRKCFLSAGVKSKPLAILLLATPRSD